MKPAACLALLLVLASPVVQAAPARLPAAEVVEVIAADQDRRVIAALERIEGTGRRLLA
jgi:hypothetical protein